VASRLQAAFKHRAGNGVRRPPRYAAAGICSLRENFADPSEAAQWIGKDFTQLIDVTFPVGEKLSPLDRENAEHEAFAASRERVYVGRSEYFDRLEAHVESEEPPLVVLGESGSGKSALLANWAARRMAAHPDERLFIHFVGATRESAELSATLRRLMGNLQRAFSI
jgi:nephrocystin-3